MRIKELELTPPSKETIEFFKKFMREHEKGLKAIKAIKQIKKTIRNKDKIGYAFCDTRLFEIEVIINEVIDANV